MMNFKFYLIKKFAFRSLADCSNPADMSGFLAIKTVIKTRLQRVEEYEESGLIIRR
jgi:hypothetical protein